MRKIKCLDPLFEISYEETVQYAFESYLGETFSTYWFYASYRLADAAAESDFETFLRAYSVA